MNTEKLVTAGRQKQFDKNLSQCHYVHHKSHMNWPWIESSYDA